MKYFFFDVVSQSGVDSADAVCGDVREILAAWHSLSPAAGSFLGIHCKDDVVVQIMLDDSVCATIDVPVPEKFGSMTKQVAIQKCASVIKQVCVSNSPNSIDGLEFVKW